MCFLPTTIVTVLIGISFLLLLMPHLYAPFRAAPILALFSKQFCPGHPKAAAFTAEVRRARRCLEKKHDKKMTETPPKPDARQLERLAAFLRLIPETGALDRLLRGAALLEEQPTTA